MIDSNAGGTSGHETERQFIRHPAHVPIHVTSMPPGAHSRVSDVSHGGLSFICAQAQERGAEIEIRIPEVDPGFRVCARVVWCHAVADGYRVGVRFLDPEDAYRSRMVEQLCAIESYRRAVLDGEGRDLTGEQAAREWIARHGDRFPNP